MAKPPLESPFRKTSAGGEQPQPEPGTNADLDEGRIMSAGVGITEGEMAALDQLAERHDVSRNSLMRHAVRLFIMGVRAGTVDIESLYEEPERPRKRSRIGKQTRR